ncbi:MAG: phage/plasmid primase, P4 family [Pirellulales bacterium]
MQVSMDAKAVQESESDQPSKNSGNAKDARAKISGKRRPAKCLTPAALAKAICNDRHFAMDSGANLFHFHAGAYRPNGDGTIRSLCKRLLVANKMENHWSSHLASETVEFIKADAPQLWERPGTDSINVLNGIVRLSDRALLPHSPEYLSPIQLPVEFDPAATCPATEKFVDEVFPDDARHLAWEIAGWLMVPYTGLGKAVLLLGDGHNGKSTWLTQLVAFLGTSNVASLALHRLESDRFAVARLSGKLANICADLPSKDLEGTSVFKQVTGGDYIQAENKYGHSFSLLPYSRLIFSANHPPRSPDSSEGFYRRWLTIPFHQTIAKPVEKTSMDAMLAAPAELSGLLNRAISGLASVLARSPASIDKPKSVVEAGEDLRSATDPTSAWLTQNVTRGAGSFVPKSRLLAAMNSWASKRNIPALTQHAATKAVERFLGCKPDIKQRTVSGKLEWCFVGLGLLADSQHSQV